jgi:hypothetical protein
MILLLLKRNIFLRGLADNSLEKYTAEAVAAPKFKWQRQLLFLPGSAQ